MTIVKTLDRKAKPGDYILMNCGTGLFQVDKVDKIGNCVIEDKDKIHIIKLGYYSILDIQSSADILDYEEKEYIGNIIKPFIRKHNEIIITKEKSTFCSDSYYILIEIKSNSNNASITLPYFSLDSEMYDKMVPDMGYDLKQLGLENWS